ncbi:hypothetical protein BD847_2035 [Flavobacterium cutihirudinis]|uniref:Uncharacterized protein n=1 Tax=Flavobacterium cutihirudinis TaxID=1265740 RepID=A0A3D9FX07_9FLAO|nr:hypothetical protein [Flavobacterium cutihirudinis]RED25286.1 hypothetical protein BD847_2035 [Flavobacterium cutihirudinis]
MKKISLKNIFEGMKREEMRMIQGGCGCGAGLGHSCIPNSPVFNCAAPLKCIPKPLFPGDTFTAVCS